MFRSLVKLVATCTKLDRMYDDQSECPVDALYLFKSFLIMKAHRVHANKLSAVRPSLTLWVLDSLN